MAYLLDTHTLIWATIDDPNLSKTVRKIIKDRNTDCYYSFASLWEITIKYSQGKLSLKGLSLEGFFAAIDKFSYAFLEMQRSHLLTLAKLYLHHRDPFDRILIAQATAEGYTFVTKDSEVHKYPVQNIW